MDLAPPPLFFLSQDSTERENYISQSSQLSDQGTWVTESPGENRSSVTSGDPQLAGHGQLGSATGAACFSVWRPCQTLGLEPEVPVLAIYGGMLGLGRRRWHPGFGMPIASPEVPLGRPLEAQWEAP